MRKTLICIFVALTACACSKPDQAPSSSGSDSAAGDSGTHNTIPTQRAGDVANKADQQQKDSSDATK